MKAINLSSAAQDHLLAVLANNPEYKYVRLGVRGGGCSGFEYSIGLLETTEPDWSLFEYPNSDDVKLVVCVDPISMMYLEGVEVDYIESLEQSGFKFHNPNMKTSCGCGKSFSV